MGRSSRLRRGYSLEVIFEEDSDFCSHQDSLDAIAYRRRQRQREQETSVDSLVGDNYYYYQHQYYHLPPRAQSTDSGLRQSKTKPIYRSLDGLLDPVYLDTRDMDQCYVEWDEFSPEESSIGGRLPTSNRESFQTSTQGTSSTRGGGGEVEMITPKVGGRRSRVSRRQIIEANWIDATMEASYENGETDLSMHNSSRHHGQQSYSLITPPSEDYRYHQFRNSGSNSLAMTLPAFSKSSHSTEPVVKTGDSVGLSVVTHDTTDTLDSYVSTLTDDTNAYAFADPYDDLGSATSSTFESSTSPGSSSSSSVCTASGNFQQKSHVKSQEVKKVRAMFELPKSASIVMNASKNKSSSTSSGTSPEILSPTTTRHRIYATANSHTKYSGHSGVAKRLKHTYSSSGGGKMDSAFSKSLTQLHRPHDFGELLINENVVIEDSPDIFQLQRSRYRDSPGKKVTSSNFFSSSNSTAGNSATWSLRRSKSIGGGIELDEDVHEKHSMTSLSAENISNTNGARHRWILDEEMPAPDTVKNARTVFEQMCSSKRKEFGNNNYMSESNSNTLTKTISSIKSNPTSKIFRAESFREDTPTLSRRFGKPILLNERCITPTNLERKSEENQSFSSVKLSSVARKLSEPIKSSSKVFSSSSSTPSLNLRQQKESAVNSGRVFSDDESSSHVDDNGSQVSKVIPVDVMQRIRSCGTTTTYFGGQIVSKTVRNRKLPISRRHTVDFRDYGSLADSVGRSVSTTPTNLLCNDIDDDVERASSVMSDYYFCTRGSIEQECMNTLTRTNRIRATSNSPGTFTKSSSSGNVNSPLKPHTTCGCDLLDYTKPSFHLPTALETIYSATAATIMKSATAPRIISVLPKSQSNSPTKSTSPTGSIIEGRNSPEGCESSEHGNAHTRSEWINETESNKSANKVATSTTAKVLPSGIPIAPKRKSKQQANKTNNSSNSGKENVTTQDKNNNVVASSTLKTLEKVKEESNKKKFSQMSETGAWF